MAQEPVELSVVVPVYQCEGCLEELHRRLTSVLSALVRTHEIVLVDDRSADCSWRVMRRLSQGDPTIRLVRFSRNFGQQAAITAGLAAATGRWTVVMDCDLQDPPELIPRLYAKAQEGYDVVLARRISRTHSALRMLAAGAYFRFVRAFLGVEISGEYGSFSLIAAKVRNEFLRVRDTDRHYLPIVLWLGFERADIDFEHGERFAGKSSYSFLTLCRLAAEGIFFQTTTLLRWIVYAGFVIAAIGAGLAAFFVISWAAANPYPGWTSLTVLLLLLGGFIIISTGVTGLYIGKIFKQVKDRPLYIVDYVGEDDDYAPQLSPADTGRRNTGI
jgi:dolichol-phosphate mannosyltransferase